MKRNKLIIILSLALFSFANSVYGWNGDREPENKLDLEYVNWLKGYCDTFSHFKKYVDSTDNRIFHIDSPSSTEADVSISGIDLDNKRYCFVSWFPTRVLSVACYEKDKNNRYKLVKLVPYLAHIDDDYDPNFSNVKLAATVDNHPLILTETCFNCVGHDDYADSLNTNRHDKIVLDVDADGKVIFRESYTCWKASSKLDEIGLVFQNWENVVSGTKSVRFYNTFTNGYPDIDVDFTLEAYTVNREKYEERNKRKEKLHVNRYIYDKQQGMYVPSTMNCTEK